MRRVLVARAPSPGERIALDDAQAHYLLRVLRLRDGDPVTGFDGAGTESDGQLAVGDGGTALVGIGAIRQIPRPTDRHLLLALPKGPAADLAVRMATELGCTDFHPLLASRSVATGDRADRWERIAVAAARQCGRPDVPRVHRAVRFEQSFDALDPAIPRWLASPDADTPGTTGGPFAVWIGPEGGWTPPEVAFAYRSDCRPFRLGRWTLRVDTAVAAALALLGGA